MATAVIMPRQGQSVESCLIGKWNKKKGDKVMVGDVLFVYETDKATFEEASQVEGILLDVFFEEGDDVECLVNVCVIGTEGESTAEFRPGSGSGEPNAEMKDAGKDHGLQQDIPTIIPTVSGYASDEPKNPEVFPFETHDLIKISPRAKRLAERTKANLSYAVPSGPNGRVIERDVQAVLAKGYRGEDKTGDGSPAHSPSQLHTGEDFEIVPLSNVRKYIAKVMCASLAGSAQLTSHSSFDATDVFELRKKLKSMEEYSEYGKITVTDIIVYAASRVLLKHKYINAHLLGDKISLFNNAHIGVAVDTPRGLLVPTIFNANTMSLTEISAHSKMLFEKCKQGSIEPDFLKGATFTISNLGALGVEMFTPILNPPQTGILGVCNTIERTKNGKPYPALGLSLTYDHQAMDGADSARFLKALIQFLEDFSMYLLIEENLI